MPKLPIVLGAVALIAGSISAQTAETGVISGRVFNPANGQYLRNASIRVEETGQTVTSGDGGEYRIGSVAAGPKTVVVTYTGFNRASASVNVVPGSAVTRDFDLVGSSVPGAAEGAVVKIDQIEVSS